MHGGVHIHVPISQFCRNSSEWVGILSNSDKSDQIYSLFISISLASGSQLVLT